jgi:uncharacterized membrane protein YGL010W
MATPFRPAQELLTQYARYHRDRRNIATHFVGVPIIVFAVGVLLSAPSLALGPVQLTPSWLLCAAVAMWYLTRGEPALGAASGVAVGLLTALAHRFASWPFGPWLALGLGTFVVGWVIQFIGHWYEGRKPAFADDLVGLIVAPMFLVLEGLAPLGLFDKLMNRVVQQAGPTHLRDMAHPVA